MKRPRIPTKQPQPAARPLQPDELTRIRGGHAQVDPIAGAFHNSDPVAADQQ